MIKKIFLFFVSLFIGIGLFNWIIGFVGQEEIERAFSVFTGWQGFIIFILTLLMMLIGNWKWKEILEGEDTRVPFWELFHLYLAGFAVMFLAPVLFWAGEISRAYVLRKKQVSRPKAIASVLIDRVLEWTSNLTVIILGLLFFLSKSRLPSKGLGLVFGGAFFIFFVAIFLFYFKTFKRESMAKAIAGIFYDKLSKEPLETEKEIFRFFKIQNKAMWKSFILSFLRAGVMYLRVWVLIIFLDRNISASAVLSILGFTYLASMIPIPTSLGSHEAIQTFAFNALGLGASSATAFTMIIRAAELLLALVGIIFFFRLGAIVLKDFLFEKIERFADRGGSE